MLKLLDYRTESFFYYLLPCDNMSIDIVILIYFAVFKSFLF